MPPIVGPLHNLYHLTDSKGQARYFLDDLELNGVLQMSINWEVDQWGTNARAVIELICDPSIPPPQRIHAWEQERTLRLLQWKKEITEEFNKVLSALEPEESNDD